MPEAPTIRTLASSGASGWPEIRKRVKITRQGGQRLLQERRSMKCPACGKRKEKGHCFCVGCYFQLPWPLRNELYVPAHEGDAWFESYVVAKVLLRIHRREGAGRA